MDRSSACSLEYVCPPNSCPVCLSDLDDCQLGRPECCSHLFCQNCIIEWSKVRLFLRYTKLTANNFFSLPKNVNTCPVDRTSFNYILVLNGKNRSVIRKVSI